MAILTKSQQVLKLDEETEFNVTFLTSGWEEDGLEVPNTGLILSKDQWEALGHPQFITMTVDPGDRLNDETWVDTSVGTDSGG